MMGSMASQSAPGWVPNTTTDFKMRLRILRLALRWTLLDAEHHTGIKKERWSSWETGRYRVVDQESIARQIAAVTGVDVVWLLTGVAMPGAGDLQDGDAQFRWPAAVTTPSAA